MKKILLLIFLMLTALGAYAYPTSKSSSGNTSALARGAWDKPSFLDTHYNSKHFTIAGYYRSTYSIRKGEFHDYRIKAWDKNKKIRYGKIRVITNAISDNYSFNDAMKNSRGWSDQACFKNSNRHLSCDISTRGDEYIYYYTSANLSGAYSIEIKFLDPIPENRPKDVGDLVARDLDVKIGGALGHIGIWTGSKVLEVLNERTVIQQNQISKFVRASRKYWGSSYGKGTYAQRLKAVQIGWNERKYDPTYSYMDIAFPGSVRDVWEVESYFWEVPPSYKIVKRRIIERGTFRCDSFVLYNYRKAGVRLLSGPY